MLSRTNFVRWSIVRPQFELGLGKTSLLKGRIYKLTLGTAVMLWFETHRYALASSIVTV